MEMDQRMQRDLGWDSQNRTATATGSATTPTPSNSGAGAPLGEQAFQQPRHVAEDGPDEAPDTVADAELFSAAADE